MGNKKVKNARGISFDDITFKSHLELACYKRLKGAGLPANYEPEKIKLFSGFKLSNLLYFAPIKKKGKYHSFISRTNKIMDITYTPDFVINDFRGYNIYIDTKGMPNETYPIKKKLFFKVLEERENKSIFFEPHSIAQIDETINIILNL